MDFIERFFGISPDGGDGLFEIVFIVLLVMIIGAIWLRASNAIKTKELRKLKKRY